MTENKRASRGFLGSDLKRVDAHIIQRREYHALPELTEDMFVRGKVSKDERSRKTRRINGVSVNFAAIDPCALAESVAAADGPRANQRYRSRFLKTLRRIQNEKNQ